VDRLRRRLGDHSVIGLDTSIFIYHLEAHPRYQALAQVVLGDVQSGNLRAVTSTVTVMELTVPAWRGGRQAVARAYEGLLVHFPHLSIADVTRDVARRAAQLRARFGVRPADALQVATALAECATAFVTNDRRLSRLAAALDVIVLDDFVVR
jgi:predicted nucleic acid-binding protein